MCKVVAAFSTPEVHVRTGVVALTLAVLVIAPRAAHAQFSFDARRIGMGGVSLSRDGNVRRYNPAYRAVKNRSSVSGAPKFSMPVPLGLIQFMKDHPLNQLGHDPAFNPSSTAFNPVELMNLVFNPPIFYEVRPAPAPTNDVEFTVGRNQLVMNLGGARVLIPEDKFGLGTTSRLLDFGMGFGGVHVGVMGFLQYDVGFTLDSALRQALTDTVVGFQPSTNYNILGDGVAQAGFAPTISFATRVMRGKGGGDDSDDGIYVGVAGHYYVGASYARARGPAGFVTGNPIFGSTPLGVVDDTLYTANGTLQGHGFGGDAGIAWITGPFEVGFGANDIGAELTWSDTKVQWIHYNAGTDSISTTLVANHVQSKTKLPITYVANAAMRMGTGTTVGGDVVNSGRGSVIHVGVEQRTGPFALRGGVARDQRKKIQFGWGGGFRLGPLGLDVGFWTHSNSLSPERAITMATSISIY
jgi:hypothetical protein